MLRSPQGKVTLLRFLLLQPSFACSADPGQAHLAGRKQWWQVDYTAWLCTSSACPSTDGAEAQQITSSAPTNSANMSIDWVSLLRTEPQIPTVDPWPLTKPPWRWPFKRRAFQAGWYLQAQPWPSHSIDTLWAGTHTGSKTGLSKGHPCNPGRYSQPCWAPCCHPWADPNIWLKSPSPPCWQHDFKPKPASFAQLEVKEGL